MGLYCAMCREEKSVSSFTPFRVNPALADRNGRVTHCRDCCNEYVNERDNTKEALKEVLRFVDIPYLDNFADSAYNTYQKKLEETNIVTRENVATGKKSKRIESSKLQTTIYACYCSRIGVIPKGYTNFSFSDGIREDKPMKTKSSADDKIQKEIDSAIRYLTKNFSKQIYEDKETLAKATKLKIEEYSLHKNDNLQRQNKFRLRQHIMTLIKHEMLELSMFNFVYEDGQEEEDTIDADMSIKFDNYEIDIPDDFDVDSMVDKWGVGYTLYEYVLLERKYKELKRNYETKTASHEEFLKHACIASVKGSLAMASGDVDIAGKWMKIFGDMTSAGKYFACSI